MRFRLLFGQHIGDNPDGEQVTYNAGDVIETDIDLVKKFGANRFLNMDDDIRVVPRDSRGPHGAPDDEGPNPNRFPGGQVSEGFQHSAGGDPEVLKQRAAEQMAARSQAKAEGVKDQSQSKDAAEKDAGSGPTFQPASRVEEVRQAQQDQQSQAPSTPAGSTQKAPSQQKKRPDFDKMSLNEMNAYAAEEEIDLKGAKSRADVLRALKASAD